MIKSSDLPAVIEATTEYIERGVYHYLNLDPHETNCIHDAVKNRVTELVEYFYEYSRINEPPAPTNTLANERQKESRIAKKRTILDFIRREQVVEATTGAY